jgi:hypothetical protein
MDPQLRKYPPRLFSLDISHGQISQGFRRYQTGPFFESVNL